MHLVQINFVWIRRKSMIWVKGENLELNWKWTNFTMIVCCMGQSICNIVGAFLYLPVSLPVLCCMTGKQTCVVTVIMMMCTSVVTLTQLTQHTERANTLMSSSITPEYSRYFSVMCCTIVLRHSFRVMNVKITCQTE